MTKAVTISSGHWNALNSGASRILNEVTEARKVVKRVCEILKSSEAKVNEIHDNQSKSQKENLNYLIGQHKKLGANLNISVHFNSSTGEHERAIGTEVFYYESGQKLNAIEMSKAMAISGNFINRSAKYSNVLGFLLTLKNALLLEVCFVNSKEDARLYNQNFEKICQSIAETIAKILGVTINKENKIKTNSEKLVPYRVQSGSFTLKSEAELAKKKVSASGIAKEEYIKIHEINGRFYLITGTYASEKLANEALEKMKRLGIVQFGSLVKT